MADYFIEGRGNVKTTLSEKVILEGELSFEDSLEIRGEFFGTIRSKGLLVVGPMATIHGDIYSKDLVVEGKVTGNILVYHRLSVESSAEITGNVTTNKIKVMNNAILEGNCLTLEAGEVFSLFEKAVPATVFRDQYPSDKTQTPPPNVELPSLQKEKLSENLLSPSKKQRKK